MTDIKTITIHIAYGFCEGPQLAAKLIESLKNRNIEITNRADKADIIFAHSGGCYLLPNQLSQKLVLIVGLPYWPDKSLALSLLQKISRDYKYHRHDRTLMKWSVKTFWNSVYFFKLASSYKMLISRKYELGRLSANWVILLRNKEDTMLPPDIDKLPKDQIDNFISITGEHDDCWLNPEIYSDIVERLLKQYDDSSRKLAK